ncbi:hypothetical protein PCASD_07730 [Puccinia coronata f. sp. avenae]|uniref:No apical meristem-associated C-terminal domain-containing protein n=1 Tax=Puccinia coronata f. sp. avenae TaxID=200324 RepID=A0A2N5UX96_9BASI|nr:hypothetical protein PCASD_07730 [Puccinia coronata f. sp. avenae]
MPSPIPGTPDSSMAAALIPPSTTGSSAVPSREPVVTNTPAAGSKRTTLQLSVSRPPANGGTLPWRHGKTKENPKKEDVTGAEKICQDALEQAKMDREAAHLQASLDQEAAAEREAARKDTRIRDCIEDNRRYEASQWRMAIAQAAMMTMLGQLIGRSSSFNPAASPP